MDWQELQKLYTETGEQSRQDRAELERMLKNNHPPALRRMRRQLLLEGCVWTVFLVVFYDFFDGALRPLGWTVALVAAVLLVLVHNVLGYRLSRAPIAGPDLRRSLARFLVRLRRYAYFSIGSRVLAILVLFGFFLAGLADWEPRHFVSLGIIGGVVLLQVYGLYHIWMTRIRRVRENYAAFAE